MTTEDRQTQEKSKPSPRLLLCLGIMVFLLVLNSSPVLAETLGVNYSELHQAPAAITNNDLRQISQRMRDLARFLSPKWPLTLEINSQEQTLLITDFKSADVNWTPLTVGYGLVLVSQERARIEGQTDELFVDVRATDRDFDKTWQIDNIPLADFCYLLEQNIGQGRKKSLFTMRKR